MRAQDPERVTRAIGRRIAELRREKGWTQAALAEQLDVTVKYVQRIEAGTENLAIRSLVTIANVLGVPIAALLERPVSMAPARRGRPPSTPRS